MIRRRRVNCWISITNNAKKNFQTFSWVDSKMWIKKEKIVNSYSQGSENLELPWKYECDKYSFKCYVPSGLKEHQQRQLCEDICRLQLLESYSTLDNLVPRKLVFLLKCDDEMYCRGTEKISDSLFLLVPPSDSVKDLYIWNIDQHENLTDAEVLMIRTFLKGIKALIPLDVVNELSWENYFDVRVKVFVDEQKVPIEEELDAADNEVTTTHFTVRDANSRQIVGVCRMRQSGPYTKLERVAVLQTFRGKGFGEVLTLAAVRLALRKFPKHVIVAHAQCEKLTFYSRLGFLAISQPFDECGIMHTTIYFPSFEENTLIMTENPDHISEVEGDCYDLQSVENIRRFQKLITTFRFIPLSSLMLSLSDGVGKWKRNLIKIAVAIQNLQMHHLEDLTFFNNFKCLPEIGDPKECESKLFQLIRLGWERLNTGLYGEVPECWRSFYAIVKLCEAVCYKCNGDEIAALKSIDEGILMGRQEALTHGRFLSKCADSIQKTAPKMTVDWSKMDLLPHPSPRPLPTKCEWWSVKEFSFLDIDGVIECISAGLPCIIRAAAKEWPAMKNWSFQYLLDIAAYRIVPVEIGSRYDGDDWTQKLMTIGKFITDYVLESPEEGPGYLAQHRLLDQIPVLYEDLDLNFVSPFGVDVDWNVWVGPSGTVSSMHNDPRENFFIQIVGRKFFRLAHSCESENLYPRDDILKNTSQVDLECPDLEWFPRFGKVHTADVEVDPGDILYIPKGFWHFVKALTPSMSVSAWFDQL